MPKIDDSSGAYIDLKENRGATLWRGVVANDIPDLAGYTCFVRLKPRNEPVIDIVPTVVLNDIQFSFDTLDLPNKCAYEVGWTDPTGKIEVIMYGLVILV